MAISGATTIYALPYPLETDAPTDMAAALQALATAVDAIISTAYHCVQASLPAPAKFGRWVYTTDAGNLYFDTGSALLGFGPGYSIRTYTEYLVALAPGGATPTLNLALANEFALTLSANATLSFSNVPGASSLRLAVGLTVAQPAGTAYTVTWPSSVDWGAPGAPPVTASGKTDSFGFVTDNAGATWRGHVIGQGF